ncbi:MAG: LON peptidase substrate-binding domain-containing protein [Phycisphaerae bacterium]|nr:LON peptidase substrate-binding domain-containing protein [Phycisphaerae bacterium]
MSARGQTIRVDFGRPVPLFPLHVVTLMPHARLGLHAFEDRYKQLVSEALDGPGQIAMAVFAGTTWRREYHANPPLRPAVCVGQIIEHQRLPDGRYNLQLHGICRARIVEEHPPEEGRPYRTAELEPLGLDMPDETELQPARTRLERLLTQAPMTDLRDSAGLLEHIRNEDIPTAALIELFSSWFPGEPELKYRLLSEADAMRRVRIIEGEFTRLRDLLVRAIPQRQVETPKGCCWN